MENSNCIEMMVSTFIIDNKKQGILDDEHFETYTKLLFSKAEEPNKSDSEKKSSYYLDGNFEETYKIDDNSFDTFIDKMKDSNIDTKTLSTDSSRVLFFITGDDWVVSNFIAKDDEDKIYFTFSEETMLDISVKYLNGNVSDFVTYISDNVKNKVVNDINGRNINLREVFDKYVHNSLNQELSTEQTLLSISHQDQESIYHIHRIFK